MVILFFLPSSELCLMSNKTQFVALGLLFFGDFLMLAYKSWYALTTDGLDIKILQSRVQFWFLHEMSQGFARRASVYLAYLPEVVTSTTFLWPLSFWGTGPSATLENFNVWSKTDRGHGLMEVAFSMVWGLLGWQHVGEDGVELQQCYWWCSWCTLITDNKDNSKAIILYQC